MIALALMLGGLLIAAVLFAIANIRERKLYRALWIEMGRKWEIVRAERDEWIATAQCLLTAKSNLETRLALRKQEVTKLYAGRDSFLNGDRSCVNGHRYHTGEGVSCPNCGGDEIKETVWLYSRVVSGPPSSFLDRLNVD